MQPDSAQAVCTCLVEVDDRAQVEARDASLVAKAAHVAVHAHVPAWLQLLPPLLLLRISPCFGTHHLCQRGLRMSSQSTISRSSVSCQIVTSVVPVPSSSLNTTMVSWSDRDVSLPTRVTCSPADLVNKQMSG